MVASSSVHSNELNIFDGVQYMQEMYRLGRLVVVRDLKGAAGLCTFFLCRQFKDVARFYRKRVWDIPIDDADGDIAYIDKLIAREWNGTMRKMIQEALLIAHPHVRCAVWMRPSEGKDRVCFYFRKGGSKDVAKV